TIEIGRCVRHDAGSNPGDHHGEQTAQHVQAKRERQPKLGHPLEVFGVRSPIERLDEPKAKPPRQQEWPQTEPTGPTRRAPAEPDCERAQRQGREQGGSQHVPLHVAASATKRAKFSFWSTRRSPAGAPASKNTTLTHRTFA